MTAREQSAPPLHRREPSGGRRRRMFGWDPWALEPGFPHRRVLRAGTVITAVLGGGFVGVVLLLVLRIPDLPAPAMAVGVVLALGVGMLMARRLLRGTGEGAELLGPAPRIPSADIPRRARRRP
ncbi:hypothetical protein M4D54_03465 [Brachybacterium sp. p3-SID1565]|uniref:hypothetical protein n=1 Tax=Brachybacterium sp. p3-SID1565 TaxID=2916046 RepID=UPI0021A6B56B|nr:hypothetical protein [Brachybacterium sp. p3-SID1565]MCT1384697.1 hypothetical protein [Brachybacterium sp. p3-SID1565]